MDIRLARIIGNIHDGRLRDVAFNLLDGNRAFEIKKGSNLHHVYAGGLLEHSLEVARISCMLADYFEDITSSDTGLLSRDYLIFGSIIHDIGKLEKHSEERKHIKKGAKVVKKALKIHGGFSKPEIKQIVNIIESHSYASHTEHNDKFLTLEAYLVSMADSLSAVLSAGILKLNQGNTEYRLYKEAILYKALIGE